MTLSSPSSDNKLITMSEFSLPKADDVDDDAVRRFGVSLFHTFDTGTPLTVKLAFFIRVLPFKDAETTRSFDSVQDIVVLLVLLGMVRRAAVERDPTRLLGSVLLAKVRFELSKKLSSSVSSESLDDAA